MDALERGDKLDELVARSEELNFSAQLFSASATSMRKSRRLPSFRGRSSLSSKDVVEEDHSHTIDTVNVLSTTTEAGMSSTSFAIPRRSTIDADVSSHRSCHSLFSSLGNSFLFRIG